MWGYAPLNTHSHDNFSCFLAASGAREGKFKKKHVQLVWKFMGGRTESQGINPLHCLYCDAIANRFPSPFQCHLLANTPLAVQLHVLDIDVPPEGGVPVGKAAPHQGHHVPQQLQHAHLGVRGHENEPLSRYM